ncbi:hypothetical protein BJ999_007168 [Actinomadura citrea]|uniref:Uncharacterized protein n=1 Tax=Actinomadura citrea TaxID=46158 RepID=A0A7Y9GI34_9ACTN|nr:hypothetical protein [Actinomadura citrea]
MTFTGTRNSAVLLRAGSASSSASSPTCRPPLLVPDRRRSGPADNPVHIEDAHFIGKVRRVPYRRAVSP